MPKRQRFESLRSILPKRSARLVTGLVIMGVLILFAIVGPLFNSKPNAIDNVGVQGPSAAHWLGTTQLGQDVFAQISWSLRGSLIIGLSVAVIATVISIVLGVFGTYVGGWLDQFFALVTNVFLVIPSLPLAIVIAALSPSKGTGMLIFVLSMTSWAGSSRVLRAQTLSMRGRDYVAAAQIAGLRPLKVITVEILPNLLPILASQFTFHAIFAILGEASLSFIGLGSPKSNSLGTMLFMANGANALQSGYIWWFLPPGFLVALIGAGLAFINFAIDEVVNPKLRTMRFSRRRWTQMTGKKVEVA